MHERNPYTVPPDFQMLAEIYPPLKPHLFQTLNGSQSIDFKDVRAQRRLTEALLHRDFRLSLSLPEGRLCPAVPNRLNYILWIQDILAASDIMDSEPVVGIDIGTGASAIYPMLACRLKPSWTFIATEIDDVSRQSAELNIKNNHLAGQIEVLFTTPSDPLLLPFQKYPDIMFAFTMCNPPFYASVDEIAKSADAKLYNPNAVCTGAEVEMITSGGESKFVRSMIQESTTLQVQCRLWFTSMLGKLSSVAEIVDELRRNNIDNYAITELLQGQTSRWAVAWSFGFARLPDSITRQVSDSLTKCLPLPNNLRQPYPQARSLQHLVDALKSVLMAIEGVRMIQEASRCAAVSLRINAFATENTWSRASRRKKRQESGITVSQNSERATHALQVLIQDIIIQQKGNVQISAGWGLECLWVQGEDRALFESFWNHVSRKVGSSLMMGSS